MIRLEFHSKITYKDTWGDLERGPKVVVIGRIPFRGGDALALEFVVDTGAPWTIIDPVFLPELAAEPTEVEQTVWFCGRPLKGQLFRTAITFGTMDSLSVAVDATVLFPTLGQNEPWPHPNFLGLSTLERLRWGLEPDRSLFYYAPLS